jgi:hypothetical protein
MMPSTYIEFKEYEEEEEEIQVKKIKVMEFTSKIELSYFLLCITF